MKEVNLLGQVNMPAQRIVSLLPSLTETIFLMGLGSKVVGVTEQCNYPEEAREREKVGSFAHADLERIRRLRPDLILTSGPIHSPFLDALRDYDVSVLVLSPRSVEGILEGMEEMARLAGEEEPGREFVASLRERVQAVWGRSKSHPPRVFLLMKEDRIVVPTRSSYQSDAIRLAGGNLLALDCATPSTSIPLEDVLSFDPEIIISCGKKSKEKPPCLRAVEEIEDWERWKTTSAARRGTIYAIPCEYLCRRGPRLVDGIEWMSELFQP